MEELQAVLTDLNQVIPILIHWLHVLSAVIWIGGLAFLVMAVTPGLRTSVPREYIRPITETFYRQYKRVVGVILGVILFTGGINLHYVSKAMTLLTGSGISQNAKYLTIFFIKLALVLGVLTVFLYTVMFQDDVAAEEHDDDPDATGYEPVPFQRGTLWMGVFIILCASAMKHLHS